MRDHTDLDERARGAGGRRRSLLNTPHRPPRPTAGMPLHAGLHDDEQTTEATAAPTVVPHHDDQTTDLTGRPGTPSAVRRRVQHRNRGPRSLLGPEAYHVGDGIRPLTTDVTSLMDPADRPTDHGDPEEILARLAGLRFPDASPPPPDRIVEAPSAGKLAAAAFELENWDEPEHSTPAGAAPRTRTDPFGLHLPTDEVDLLARAGATIETFERSFFERDTQPIPRGHRALFGQNSNLAAAIAVFVFGLVAVISLTVSAWIALSTPPPAVSSASEPDRTLPQVPPSAPAPSHGSPAGAPPPPPPERDGPTDPAAAPPEQSVADLPT